MADEARRPAPSPGNPPGDGADALLEVEDLRTSFLTPAGPVRAVDGVTFHLRRGETLGIVGESGSGKSVLSRSIMGLLPPEGVDRAGSVRFDGAELSSLDPRELRRYWGRSIAMVFQDPMTSLNPTRRIGSQLVEGMRRHLGLDSSTAKARALGLLDSVGIPAAARRLRQYPHELSGGMRQRVTIAMALACDPVLLIADEPTTALDVTVQAQILALLEEQQAARQMAMILITHDLGIVAEVTDRLAVMYAGQLVEVADTRSLFRERRMPYTDALMRSIPSVDRPARTRLESIPGRPPPLLDLPSGCRFAPRCGHVRDRCHEQAPPLLGEPDHLARCWFPLGGSPAAARDGRAGVPA
ncbi:MAG: ABC transporter ATP-binding protein [Acidimicrobiia bacterium]